MHRHWSDEVFEVFVTDKKGNKSHTIIFNTNKISVIEEVDWTIGDDEPIWTFTFVDGSKYDVRMSQKEFELVLKWM